MNVPKINRDELIKRAHDVLNKISQQKTPLQPAEVDAALRILQHAAEVLESDAIDAKAIKKHVSLLDLATQIQNSPSFATALGVYQTQFANLLGRIEYIIRKNNGTSPVKKIDGTERLEDRF